MKSMQIFGVLIIFYLVTMFSLWYFQQKQSKESIHASISPQQVHVTFIDPETALITWSTRSKPDNCQLIIKKTHFPINEQPTIHWGHYIFKKEIPNLPFGKVLTYQIQCQKIGFSISRKFDLKTHPGFEDKVTIAILGDWSTCGIGDAWNYQHTQTPKTNVLVPLMEETKNYWSIWHLGDIAYDLHSNQGIRGNEFLKDIEPIVSQNPYMPVVGNHQFRELFLQFGTRFRPDLFYSMQVGKATIFVFNSEFVRYKQRKEYPYNQSFLSYLQQKQFKKLEQTVKNINRQEFPWLVAMMHTPLYFSQNPISEMMKRVYWTQSPVLRNRFKNVLIQFQFDLVFAGHIHLYQRTFPISDMKRFVSQNNQEVFENPNGPIYIVNGVAGNIQSQNIVFQVTKKPEKYSAIISQPLGYGFLNIVNKTHIYYQQLAFGNSQWDPIETDLLSTKRVVDKFYIIKTKF